MTANDAKLYLTDLWESDWTSVDETIALEMAIKALTAIEDIKAEINRKANSGQWSDATVYGMKKALAIIDKHTSMNERDCETCENSNNSKCAGTEECHLCMWENQHTSRKEIE